MRLATFTSALLMTCSPALAQNIAGVAQAVDGDTLTIGTARIRLFGVDAPEAQQTCKIEYNNWTCGAAAASALRSMVEGKPVACEPMDTDVYGRTVARCHAGGKDLGAELIRNGYAVVYGRGADLYGALEAESKAYRAGIWASEFEMPAAFREAHPHEPLPQRQRVITPARRQATPRASTGPMFWTCAQARAAGAAPMYRGQAGYNPNLDGDNDGIACEPYRGRR
jgi:endonuclease YncB( thermonuclease family)